VFGGKVACWGGGGVKLMKVSTYKSTRCCNPEDQHRHLHRRKNLTSQRNDRAYTVHICPQLDPITSQLNPVRRPSFTPYLFYVRFNIILQTAHRSSKWTFHFCMHFKFPSCLLNLYVPPISPSPYSNNGPIFWRITIQKLYIISLQICPSFCAAFRFLDRRREDENFWIQW
jgi:hypothetical protein